MEKLILILIRLARETNHEVSTDFPTQGVTKCLIIYTETPVESTASIVGCAYNFDMELTKYWDQVDRGACIELYGNYIQELFQQYAKVNREGIYFPRLSTNKMAL